MTTEKMSINRAIDVAKRVFAIAKDESTFNAKIERYQLANAKQDYSDDARIERLKKFREKMIDNGKKFATTIDIHTKKPLTSAANWKPFADYFNSTLAHMKEEDFTREAGINAAKDLGKELLQKVTKEQTDIVVTYHTNRARKTWDQVQQFRAMLEVRGLLAKKAAKIPTSEELAKIEAEKA